MKSEVLHRGAAVYNILELFDLVVCSIAANIYEIDTKLGSSHLFIELSTGSAKLGEFK